MPLGEGKYGKRAEALLREVGGDLCIVICTGRDGPAFDVATTNPVLLATIPGLLRIVADSIERDLDHGADEVLFGRRQ